MVLKSREVLIEGVLNLRDHYLSTLVVTGDMFTKVYREPYAMNINTLHRTLISVVSTVGILVCCHSTLRELFST